MVELIESQFIRLDDGQLVQAFESLSSVRISSSASSGPELADAYFIVFDQGEDRLRLYIGFLFLESKSRMLYRSQVFSSEESAEVMVQAESFVGEMGFMMDDLHYGQASEEEKREIRERIPLFYEFLEDYEQQISITEKVKAQTGLNRIEGLKSSSRGETASFEEAALNLLSLL